MQLALDGGGRDNITVIVAGYTLPDERAEPTVYTRSVHAW